MEKLVVHGGFTLRGAVNISGSKNAALAILPAVLLASKKVSLNNVPDITNTMPSISNVTFLFIFHKPP